MQKVMIVGGGKGGSAILELLSGSEDFFIVCLADTKEDAEGILAAKARNISTVLNWSSVMDRELDIIIDTTGDPTVFEEIKRRWGSKRF